MTVTEIGPKWSKGIKRNWHKTHKQSNTLAILVKSSKRTEGVVGCCINYNKKKYEKYLTSLSCWHLLLKMQKNGFTVK